MAGPPITTSPINSKGFSSNNSGGNDEGSLGNLRTDFDLYGLPAGWGRNGAGSAARARHNLLHAEFLVLGSTSRAARGSMCMSRPRGMGSRYSRLVTVGMVRVRELVSPELAPVLRHECLVPGRGANL